MKIITEKCSRCGRVNYIIQGNNPLMKGTLCVDCICNTIDPNNLEHFAFFCRTYNLPLNENLYVSCLKDKDHNPIKAYVEQLYDEDGEYSDSTTDKWKEVQKEWDKVKTHQQLLCKIEDIKDDFIARCQEKWGMEYTFEEFLKLEHQFTNIIKGLNITNPSTIDNVKKYCKMSVLVDNLIAGGEVKSINDATSTLSKLADLAQIQELSESATEGTIKTVADLYKYMEDHGFRFNYYDGVDRDIVDKTIKDIQQSTATEINNATGLDVTLEEIKNKYYNTQEETDMEEKTSKVDIDDLIQLDTYTEEEMKVDKELEEEDVIFEDD